MLKVVETAGHDVLDIRNVSQSEVETACRLCVSGGERCDVGDERNLERPVERVEFVECGIVHRSQEVSSSYGFAVLVFHTECPLLFLSRCEVVAHCVPLEFQFLVWFRHLYGLVVAKNFSVLHVHYIYIGTITPVLCATNGATHSAVYDFL